jgi:para-nitrobenzyl esterase
MATNLIPSLFTTGAVAAVLAGVSMIAAQLPGAAGLEGTAWQLVKFESGDGKVVTPTDKTRYTVEFRGEGRVAVRFDCNRGNGTWKSDGKAKLEFGPVALTRAMCPPGSMHDHLVKRWGSIRSYVIKDGHLFLSLMADGGIYEFEPLPKGQPKHN